MKPDTNTHLNRVESVVQQLKPLLGRHPYQADLRTVLVGGLVTQVIEHHESMLLLIRNGKVGSAFALSRSIFESMFRGMWFQLCATDPQLQYFKENDELPAGPAGGRINMPKMAAAIDAVIGLNPSEPEDFSFTDLKNRGWAALCSYAHSGLLQLGRRFTGQNAEPSYTDEEIFEIATSSTTCVILLASQFLASQHHDAESKTASDLIGTYGTAASGLNRRP